MFSPWKISLTDSSSKTALMALAMIAAVERTVMFGSCFSGGSGSVLVIDHLLEHAVLEAVDGLAGEHPVGGGGEIFAAPCSFRAWSLR